MTDARKLGERLTEELLYKLLEDYGEDSVYMHEVGDITVSELAGAIVAARAGAAQLRTENAQLRHALQVAHDWMGRTPEDDCDEGGGWGRAHLKGAEATVVAALRREAGE